jgi:hypothetical protein
MVGGRRFCPSEQSFVGRKLESAVDLDGCAFVIGVGSILLAVYIFVTFLIGA